MKDVRVIRATVAQGKPVKVGQKLTLPDGEANVMIAMGRAEPFVDTKEAADKEVKREITKKKQTRGAD